ncbi:LysM peptidoglycan-binding domain-containing protein [Jeotgalibacillus sp. S-D1]|uniref:cell division suppressor protein YneA n=1 Tax=Jeotgalibacillus sp. S-D1 TaxID=2552189 RepID=UPI001059F5C3|nr:LysM peptidoglycan-binding domain-containing protein [Jeotgalibacillus sp. S-D1]TDL34956.1 LysM peptidoglycan-binding domain-containing protein [Jeotgalibacillus sp. S-D1]
MSNLVSKYSFVILFIVVTLAFGLYLTFSLADEQQESFINVEVEQGDSLWSLSKEYSESLSMSEKAFIEWVTAENNLASYSIYEGEQLVLPITEQDKEKFLQDDVQLASEN